MSYHFKGCIIFRKEHLLIHAIIMSLLLTVELDWAATVVWQCFKTIVQIVLLLRFHFGLQLDRNALVGMQHCGSRLHVSTKTPSIINIELQFNLMVCGNKRNVVVSRNQTSCSCCSTGKLWMCMHVILRINGTEERQMTHFYLPDIY